MNVKVKIKSEQFFQEHQEQEEHQCKGKITHLKNGTILEFIEKIEQQELHFKMTLLKEKIRIDRQGQTMTLDYQRDDNCEVATPYGNMNMTVHTTNMQIIKQEERIQKILLEYDITLENGMKYANRVTIQLEQEE